MTSPYSPDDRPHGAPPPSPQPGTEQPGFGQQYGYEQYGQHGGTDPQHGQYGQYGQDPYYAGGQYSAPHYGQPQYGQPQYGQPQPGWGAPAAPATGSASWDTGEETPPAAVGWAPAPRQGLFPLRPLNFGEVFGTSFKLLRTNAGVSIGSSAIISAITTAISVAVPLALLFWGLERARMAVGADAQAIETALPFWMLAAAVPLIVLNYIGSGLMQAIIVQVVAAAATGGRVGFKQAWGRAWRRLWPIVGLYALLSLAALLAIAPVVALVAWIATGLRDNGGAIALVAILIIVLVLGLIVLSAWISTKLLFASSAIVLEGLGPIAAMRRSWRLVKGYFWRTFAISLLLQMVVGAVGQAVSMVGSFLLTLVSALITPTGGVAEGQEGAAIGILIVVTLVSAALGVIVNVLTVVLIAGNATIMYTDLRMRKEGLNIHLQQVVDDAAEGRTTPGDPWTAPDLGPIVPTPGERMPAGPAQPHPTGAWTPPA